MAVHPLIHCRRHRRLGHAPVVLAAAALSPYRPEVHRLCGSPLDFVRSCVVQDSAPSIAKPFT